MIKFSSKKGEGELIVKGDVREICADILFMIKGVYEGLKVKSLGTEDIFLDSLKEGLNIIPLNNEQLDELNEKTELVNALDDLIEALQELQEKMDKVEKEAKKDEVVH